MTALIEERTVERIGDELVPTRIKRLVAANIKCIKGGIAANVAGYARPGITATGHKYFGVFDETVDNLGGAAGAKVAQVIRGVFGFVNSSAGDAIAQADVGNNAYVVDDNVVAKTDGTGTRSVLGPIEYLRDGLVFVRVGG